MKETKAGIYVITARKRSCEKVMFLNVSVILSVGEGDTKVRCHFLSASMFLRGVAGGGMGLMGWERGYSIPYPKYRRLVATIEVDGTHPTENHSCICVAFYL